MSLFQEARVQRVSAQTAQQWLGRAGLLSIVAGPVIAVGVICLWLDSRMSKYEQDNAAGGVMAVVDKCGNAYDFTMTRAGEWQPDEALYFDKLEQIVDCTRGLRLPQKRGGVSCWPKTYAQLGPDAVKTLNEWMAKSFGNTDPTVWAAKMESRAVEVEILKGSTKSEDGRYRLQWRERERATGRDEYWSGTFAVSRVVASKKAVAEGNAIGLQVDSFTWQRDQVVGK